MGDEVTHKEVLRKEHTITVQWQGREFSVTYLLARANRDRLREWFLRDPKEPEWVARDIVETLVVRWNVLGEDGEVLSKEQAPMDLILAVAAGIKRHRPSDEQL